MVEYQRVVIVALTEGKRLLYLMRPNQYFIDLLLLLKYPYPTVKVSRLKKLRRILQLMTNPHQWSFLTPVQQALFNVTLAQIYPSYDARNPIVACSKPHQKCGVGFIATGLHSQCCVNSAFL